MRVTGNKPKRTSRRVKRYLHIANEIYTYKFKNISQKEVAAKFGVPQSTVSLIYLDKYK